jgi:hypothetical protein
LFNVTEIRGSVWFRRSAYGEKDDERLFYGLANVSSESQPACVGIFKNELLETRFINRHNAFEQPFDLIFVDIDARNIDAELSETSSSYQAYITTTNYGYMHSTTSKREQGCADNQNLAGHAREIRVTRKVNFG